MREVSSIIGGIGLLILTYLVLANAKAFNIITGSIASNSSGLITTLQGRGGSGSTALANLGG